MFSSPTLSVRFSTAPPAIVLRASDGATIEYLAMEYAIIALLTLVVGAIVLSVAPSYADAIIERIRTEPGESFVYGIGATVLFFVVAIALAITVVGILVLIPLALVVGFLDLVGHALAVTAIGSAVAGGHDDREVGLLVGAIFLSAVLVIPVVGRLVSLVIGTVGFGAMVADYWGSRG